MDFYDTAAEAEYRRSLRAWLRENLADVGDRSSESRAWQRALYYEGYIGQTWTVAEGGKGLPATYDAIFHHECSLAGAPLLPANLAYLGRALFRFGSARQKEQFLVPTLNGDIRWCQGFSEPNAGSDLAAMHTKAELDGDRWVINGQKLWTSGAHLSDWCFLLARTDPDVPKHKGISALLVDMSTPGVSVQPTHTSDGTVHTCETFFDNVTIPAENILGERGQGWAIAMWALQFERGPANVGYVTPMLRSLDDLERIVAERSLDASIDVRRAIARAHVDLQVLDLNSQRQLSLQATGREPDADGPVAKLLWSGGAKSLGRAWLDALGGEAVTGVDGGRGAYEYFHALPTSVYGGSAQVQRNLLSQRFMGMPKGASKS